MSAAQIGGNKSQAHPMLDAASQLVPNATQRGLATAYDRCSVPSGSRPAWCVVATLPKAERRAHANLHRFGLETYLPLVTVRWANRTWHTGPAFPGYCFVRLDLAKPWSPVRSAPGVFNLLTVDGLPAVCPDGIVEAVRNALDAAEQAIRDHQVAEKPQWAPGALLAVYSGVLRDCHCVLLSHHNGTARVAAMIAGHLCTVSVPLDCLRARDE